MIPPGHASLPTLMEAVLMAAGEPLSIERLRSLFGEGPPSKAAIEDALETLAERCAQRGYELVRVASGYRFQIRPDYAPWVAQLWEIRPQRDSRALLEVLAIIAYKQPVTRGDIERIRGVSVSGSIVRTLLDREWIEIKGYRDLPGRPRMYGTTQTFLDSFNLDALSKLPAIPGIQRIADENEARDPQATASPHS